MTCDLKAYKVTRSMTIKGVEEIRVVRGKAVIDQFGAGTKFEVPWDEIEKAVLESGKPIEGLEESFGSVKYRIVIPYKAEPTKGINCLKSHTFTYSIVDYLIKRPQAFLIKKCTCRYVIIGT